MNSCADATSVMTLESKIIGLERLFEAKALPVPLIISEAERLSASPVATPAQLGRLVYLVTTAALDRTDMGYFYDTA